MLRRALPPALCLGLVACAAPDLSGVRRDYANGDFEVIVRLGKTPTERAATVDDWLERMRSAFAALSAIWLQPAEFAAGKADASRIGRDRYPLAMATDVERWCDRYPLVKAFIERLYREERLSA